MLNERDVLCLKLALERDALDARAYARVLDGIARGERLGLALRQVGVPGPVVSDIVSASDAHAGEGTIVTRCDAENAMIRRALENSGRATSEQIARAEQELAQLAEVGQFASLDEPFVNHGWLALPQGVALRRQAKARLATCSGCWRNYLLPLGTVKARCAPCGRPVRAGEGRSASEVCQTLLSESQREAGGTLSAQAWLTATGRYAAAPRQATPPGGGAVAGSSGRYAAQPKTPGGGLARPAPAIASPATASQAALAAATGVSPGTAAAALAPAQPPLQERARVDTPSATYRRKTEAVRQPGGLPPSIANLPAGNMSDSQLPTLPLPGIPGVPPAGTEARIAAADRGFAPGSSHDDDLATAMAISQESVAMVDASIPSDEAVARFGPFEILSEVARGAMGIVYRARRSGSNDVLALKVLLSGPRATPKQVARFEREADAARRFSHPAIVRIEETGAHEGYHFIAMEYCEGETLEERVKERGPMSPQDAARVISRVADAVQAIHDGGVVHRDLKPGNVMVDAALNPKLIDFGLAKLDQDERLTKSGVMVGTPFYMAPEQVRGQKDKVGPPSDVYALGAMLFELMIGKAPFPYTTYGELFGAIVNVPAPSPRSLRPDVPVDLERLILRCLEKDPAARYPTARLLQQDLERWLSGARILAVDSTSSGSSLAGVSDSTNDQGSGSTPGSSSGSTSGSSDAKVPAPRAVDPEADPSRRLRRLLAVCCAVIVLGGLPLLGYLLGQRRSAQAVEAEAAVDALLDEARRLSGAGRHAGANSALSKARALSPERADVAWALALNLCVQGEVEGAVRELEAAVALGLDRQRLEGEELTPLRGNAGFEALRKR